MRIVFIGPPAKDDEEVHHFMLRRFETACALQVKNVGDDVSIPLKYNRHDPEGHKRYLATLEHLQEQTGEAITEVLKVVPSLTQKEDDILDGRWNGIRYFHDLILENLRIDVREAVKPDKVLVSVDLGRSLATLYAAYFVSLEGKSLLSTFHAPMGEEPFGIGGFSQYAQKHPLIRRRLLRMVLDRSEMILIPHAGIAEALRSLFPDLSSFGIDPFFDVPSEESDSELVS